MQSKAQRLLTQRSFMTAGGTETYMLFQQGFAMREFCAFEILDHPEQLAKLEADYLFPLMHSIAEHGHGLLIDSFLWRAHPDFIAALGYAPAAIERINRNGISYTRDAVARFRQRSGFDADDFPVLVAADIGPRGDGYKIGDGVPGIDAAYDYHRVQLEALGSAGVDAVCALTMTSANEAIGILKAANALGVPVIISPTVETDGRLPDGSLLGEFIARVDDASANPPIYYMVNCAHPTHLQPTLEAAASSGQQWLGRFRGLRANSSTKSHAELDNSTELDRGDVQSLATQVGELKRRFDLSIAGGCCGTDHEHIAAIARATGMTAGRPLDAAAS